MKKRLLAWLVSLSLTAGLLPVSAMGGDSMLQPLDDGDFPMQAEQSTVEAKYETADRSKATITYHKKGIAANPFNLIFLVDTSRQGKLSHEAFELMLRDSGMSYIYDYQAASNVQLIGYQQDIMQNTGIQSNKTDLTQNFGSHGTPGEGTANELVALDAAIDAVKNIKEKSQNQTVVFWVLGEEFGVQDTDAIKAKLDALKSELNEDTDALITWQLADQPNALLTQYATKHSEAHGDPNDKQPAAHAVSDTVLMQEEMAADLEEIVHDHYHNISFSLQLDENQTLVKRITGARYEASSSMASLTTTLRDDGKGLDVTIERQCRQIDLDFILEVELDTSVYEKQVVIPAGKIIADHNGNNGGLHAGLFDEQIVYDLELDLPEAILDRTAHTITFQDAGGIEPITNKLAGATVTLPMGDGLTQNGNSFGGWIELSGPNKGHRYDPGEIISMPDTDLVLTPAFGHVEVELEIDYEQGEKPVYGNQMSEFSSILQFGNTALPNGGMVSSSDIASIRVIDALPRYDKTPSSTDKNKVALTSVGGNSVDDVVYARHVGATENDAVVAYLTASQSQKNKYDMVIAGPGGAKAPKNCSSLFSGFSACTSISLAAFDTTGVTNMSNMFDSCRKLTTLTFGDGWDTSAVTDMSEMFSYCSGLTTLDLSKFNTVAVTDMSKMFYYCSGLTTLDLSKFNTAAVTNMSQMFSDCGRLVTLTFGDGWNTSAVTSMSKMFAFCSNLTELDVSKFDTSAVTSMRQMFYASDSLRELDVSKFNTAAVTDMSQMFYGCSGLTSLNLSSFNTGSVKDMYQMFHSCSGLTTLDLSSFNTDSVKNMSQMFGYCSRLQTVTFGAYWSNTAVTNMSQMFNYCTSLATLNWGSFATPNVEDMSDVFANCEQLATLDLSTFNTSKVTNMASMFYRCENLSSLTFGNNFDTSKVTSMATMFMGCESLSRLDLSKFKTTSVKSMSAMFYSCSALSDLIFGDSFDTSNVTSMANMFYKCSSLTTLDLSKFNTSAVTNMSQMFSGCSMTTLDFSSFNTSKVTNMSGMFQSCSGLTTLSFGDNFDTSNVTDMSKMFYECRSLDSITFGSQFVISKVKNISQMFLGCSKLKTIVNLGLGESNVLGNMNGLFSGLTTLETVSFKAPSAGAEFPKLSTLTNMFSGCTNLKTADMSNWKLANLTNTSNMFYGCANLENVNLSWADIAATSGNYSIDHMFDGIPVTATLTTGTYSSVMLDAIKVAFDAAKGTPANQLISLPNPEEPETPTDAPEEPETSMDTPQEPETPTDTPKEPDTSMDTPQEPETPTDTPKEPDTSMDTPQEPETPTDTPEEPETSTDTPQESETSVDTSDETIQKELSQEPEISEEPSVVETSAEDLSVMPVSMTQMRSTPAQTNDETPEAPSSLYVYPTMVNENDTITYKVTVKYVGNVGVKSGRITMEFPIPDGIIEFMGKGTEGDQNYEESGWHIATTQIKDSGSSGGYLGGRVVQYPKLVENEDGTKVIQGTFEGLYAGTEVTVSIKTTVAYKQPNSDGYTFWDGTAYATDNAGTAVSRTVRLWNLQDGGDNPTPPATSYQLSYTFTGDVPSDAVLPAVAVVDHNALVTAASTPTESTGHYTFDGWYRSDDNSRVTPGDTFTMPDSDLTLTGKWTLDDAYVQKITVKYEYTDNNDGAHIPDGAPDLTEEQTVKVGQTHYIQRIEQDASYHKFGGWVPTLSVDSGEVTLIKQSDGTYQSEDDAYTIDIAGGTLSTEQFRNKNDVVVTFGGPWTPYKGTIHFDANGGEGSMDDMENVTWDTQATLPENTFTYPDAAYKFIGWAKTASGAVVKDDQDRAHELIEQDGKTVTLYAVWKRNTYGVGYNLKHVTSSNIGTTVTLGGSYSTTLTADSGYQISDVSITMGGVSIANRVYNAETGEISISNINGNILINAVATQKATPIPTKHTITISATNGIAAPSGSIQVQDGQTQIITFTPNAGYELDSVTVDGSAASLTGNTYTFSNVTSDHTISVVYKKADSSGSGGSGGGSVTNKYPIYVEHTGNGTATSDKQEAAPGEIVTVDTNGAVIDITVVDKDGNEVSITDKGDGSFTFKMPNSEATVTVKFEQLPEVADPNDTGVADWLDTLHHHSYLNGYPDSAFRPSGNMTRAEVAQMFYNLLLNKDVAITVSFSDVKAGSWYETAVNTLASLDILKGVGKEQFAPERAITRAEFTAIAMRFAKLDKTGINIFSDVQESDWFYDYVVGSIQYGWITGYSDGTFRPDNTITRAEVTTITNRMLGRAADETYVKNHSSELRSFADVNSSHWAYYQIVEATNSHEFEKIDGTETWKNLK